jgi:hypothetical protein
MAKSLRNLESLIASGEAKGCPEGFKGQTVNGTAKLFHTGWNRDREMAANPVAEVGGPWQKNRSTRAGE